MLFTSEQEKELERKIEIFKALCRANTGAGYTLQFLVSQTNKAYEALGKSTK